MAPLPSRMTAIAIRSPGAPDVLVPEVFLNELEALTRIEQVRGDRVAERMTGGVLGKRRVGSSCYKVVSRTRQGTSSSFPSSVPDGRGNGEPATALYGTTPAPCEFRPVPSLL